MLGNHEKMVRLISSSTTNEWPQMQQQDSTQIDDLHQKSMNNNIMVSSSSSSPANSSRIMEKPGQDQLQLQQQALKCPRCDSSNTKFCYYNNYSLSQPRHFCKACKRYWTRGGTLRNVPVGGGCRKNKRVKRPGSSSSSSTSTTMDNIGGGANNSSTTSSSAPSSNINYNTSSNPSSQPAQIDQINQLFFGLPSNPNFMDSSVSHGFDLHQLNHAQLGLGFSSSMPSDSYRNRFDNYSSIFSSSPSTTTAAPTMASVLASKFINGAAFKDIQARGGPHQYNQYFQNLLPFEDLHIAAGSNHGESGNGTAKEVKVEDQGGQNRLEWKNINNNNVSNGNSNSNCQNQMTTEQMGLSDPTLYWSSTTLATNNWHDPANLGSSVSSLI